MSQWSIFQYGQWIPAAPYHVAAVNEFIAQYAMNPRQDVFLITVPRWDGTRPFTAYFSCDPPHIYFMEIRHRIVLDSVEIRQGPPPHMEDG